MTTRVGSATGANTATMPTHAVGDLIVAFWFRDGSTTAATTPSEGWIPLAASSSSLSKAGTTCCAGMVVKRADSTSEAVGTFTNATFVGVVVYRGGTGKSVGIGTWAFQAGTATSVTYPADTLIGAASTSWAGAFAGHRSTNTSLQTAPTNMTNVATFVNATDEGAIHDTNGPVASWPSTAVAVGGTASGWITAVFEVREYTDVLSRYRTARDHPTDNALVLGAGMSLLAGACSTANGMASNAISGSYLQQAASAFTACVARSSDASFFGDGNAAGFSSTAAAFNSNITLGTFASYPTAGTLGGRGLMAASAGTLSVDFATAYDRAQVFYARYVGSPEYTVNVDGGSSLGTMNMNDTPALYASETFSVSDATHQLRIVAGAANGIIAGAISWRSTVKQLTFLNFGWAAGLLTDFMSTADAYSPLIAIRTFGNVAATIIHFDANEIIGAVAVETFRYNLAVYTLERLYYGDVVLVSSAYMSAAACGQSEANQANYHNVIRDWADVMGCAYVRGTAQPGLSTFAAGDALGYYDADEIHMPSAGYAVAYKTPLLALLDVSAISGSGAVTDADDTGAGTGAVRVSGSGGVTDADDTSSASGTVSSAGITGSGAVTDADDTSSATGAVRIGGSAAATDADDAGTATGSVRIDGSASATDADDTSSASGTVSSSAITGSGAVTDADDTSSASGAVRVSGAAAANDDNDASTASGSVRIDGTASATDENDTGYAYQAAPPITGIAAANDDDDTGEGLGFVALAPGTYALAIGGGGSVVLNTLSGGGFVIADSISSGGSVVAGALRGRP